MKCPNRKGAFVWFVKFGEKMKQIPCKKNKRNELPSNVCQVLEAVLNLFGDKSAWIADTWAHSRKEWAIDRNTICFDLSVLDPRADCWCLTGGICKVMGIEPPFPGKKPKLLTRVYQALNNQLPELQKKSKNPVDTAANLENFSDDAGYLAVIQLLKRTLEHEKKT